MWLGGSLLKHSGGKWHKTHTQFILDQIQTKAFSRFRDDIDDHHRVTLFKYKLKVFRPRKQWWWVITKCHNPNVGWLVPYLRSGYTSKETNVCFMCPDDGSKAEGVAGQSWSKNSTYVVDNLPHIRQESGVNQRNKYKRRTHVEDEYLNHKLSKQQQIPRSIGAIPIEVNGKRWGVIVFDSVDPEGVNTGLMREYSVMAITIGRLLEAGL